MFQRRNKKTFWLNVRDLVWPRMGWHRTSKYVAHRMVRLPGSPSYIAVGFACGAAMSMTPFLGFHLAIAALLAVMLRGSVLASAIGTAVGNPWTMPLIFWTDYHLGGAIIGIDTGHRDPSHMTFRQLFIHPGEAFFPMAIGGVLVAFIMWPISFYVVRSLVSIRQEHRRHKIALGRLSNGKKE